MNTPFARIGDFNLKPPPEGCCQICGNEHEPAHPHNPDSFYYRVNFINQHGRPPTWRDAMAHCPPHEVAAWSWALIKLDIDLDNPNCEVNGNG